MKAHEIIGEILASWEDAANTAAIDCHAKAEEDNYKLRRYDIDPSLYTTQAEYIEAHNRAEQAIDNGRALADAWRTIAKKLRRLLRAMRVETYSQRRAKEANAPKSPWQSRREHETMMQSARVEPRGIERSPIVLDKDKLETEARANGLWAEHESKE